MKKNLSGKYTAIYFQFANIIITFVFIYYILNMNLQYEEKLFYLSWIGIISFIISITIYSYLTKIIISAYLFFYSTFIFFHFGQWILYAIQVKYKYFIHLNSYYSSFWNNNTDVLLNSISFIILVVNCFNLGVLGSLKNNEKSLYKNSKIINEKYFEITGKILLAVSIVPASLNSFKNFFYSISYGYGQIEYTNNALSVFFIPAIFILLICNKSKKIDVSLKILLIMYASVMFISGFRTEALGIILAYVIYYMIILNKKINFKRFIVLFFTGILVINTTITIAELRKEPERNLIMSTQKFFDNFINNNPIVDFIGEMGFSSITVPATQNIINQTGIHFGESYGAALITAVPESLDPTGIVNKMYQKASLGQWLTKYLNVSFGIDYSMAAELYYNFGDFGVVFAILLGFLFGKIFSYSKNDINKMTIFRKYTIIIALYSLITMPRRAFIFFINASFYNIIIVFVLTYFVGIIINSKRGGKYE